MEDVSISLDLGSTLVNIPDPIASKRRKFLTPLATPGDFLLVLDNTSLEKIKRCHLAARNYIILSREPQAKDAALSYGGALHEGIEGFLKGESVDLQNQRMLQYFTDHPTPPDSFRTPTTAIQVLGHYRHRCNELLHPDYELEVMSDKDGLLIERSFELPLGVLEIGERILGIGAYIEANEHASLCDENESGILINRIFVAWSGKIDVVARTNLRVRIIDHKTTQIADDRFIEAFRISSQTIGYLWAARQMWPDLDVSGFCLDAIVLPKKQAEAALLAGRDLMERGPKGGEPALKFFRAYFDYTPERMAEWQTDTLSFIEDFLHSLVRNHFPLNDKQCFDKFGRCPYHACCTIDDPIVRDRLLMSEAYKPVTWSPTNT